MERRVAERALEAMQDERSKMRYRSNPILSLLPKDDDLRPREDMYGSGIARPLGPRSRVSGKSEGENSVLNRPCRRTIDPEHRIRRVHPGGSRRWRLWNTYKRLVASGNTVDKGGRMAGRGRLHQVSRA